MKDNRTFLHTLPAMQEFTYYGKRYRTIIPIKETVVSKSAKKREVLDLKTNRTSKLAYFARVTKC